MKHTVVNTCRPHSIPFNSRFSENGNYKVKKRAKNINRKLFKRFATKRSFYWPSLVSSHCKSDSIVARALFVNLLCKVSNGQRFYCIVFFGNTECLLIFQSIWKPIATINICVLAARQMIHFIFGWILSMPLMAVIRSIVSTWVSLIEYICSWPLAPTWIDRMQ